MWIFGSPRTGTTWLVNLLIHESGYVKIDEPLIGVHLGAFAHETFGSPARNHPPGRSQILELQAGRPDYFFSDDYRAIWQPELRRLILGRFAAQVAREGAASATCLVKEPNGTQAAGILLRALPRSRMLWLLRDGRDVVDSEIDGISPGGWLDTYDAPWEMTPSERLRFIENRSYVWLRRTEAAQAAFERLPEKQRLLVRYEDLRADTVTELRRIHAWLGRDVEAEAASRAAQALAFESLPPELRGKGHFARSATPGAWRDNLTPEEQALVNDAIGPKLRELGYG